MASRVLVLGAIVTLAHAKAIITNQCSHPVYVWSVPSVGSAWTNNVPIYPGGRYEERWRYGTSENPGIALKISTQHNGINTGMDEVNFAYSVDPVHKTKVWIDLSPVRGKPFHDNFSFHTCHTAETSVDPHPTTCQVEENIELVLCGFDRTVSAKDTFSSKALSECFDYHHDNDKYDHSTSTKSHHTVYTTSTMTTHSTVTKHEVHTKPTTVTQHKTVTKPGHNHTVTYHQPPHYTKSYQHTSKPYSKPSQPYSSPPHYTTFNTYTAPYTSLSYPTPPVYSTPQTYPAPYTSQSHWSPPPYETSEAYSVPHTSQPYWSPPQYTTSRSYSRPHVSHPYPSPLHHTYTSTSASDYSSPHTPSYYSHGDRPEVSTRYYDVPRPTGYSDDSAARIAALICDEKHGCHLPSINGTIPPMNGTVVSGNQTRIIITAKSHDYCKPKVVYPKAFNQAKISMPLRQLEASLKDKPKKCVLPFCEPAHPDMDCSLVEHELEEKDLYLVDWTVDEDTCSSFLAYWAHWNH